MSRTTLFHAYSHLRCIRDNQQLVKRSSTNWDLSSSLCLAFDTLIAAMRSRCRTSSSDAGMNGRTVSILLRHGSAHHLIALTLRAITVVPGPRHDVPYLIRQAESAFQSR